MSWVRKVRCICINNWWLLFILLGMCGISPVTGQQLEELTATYNAKRLELEFNRASGVTAANKELAKYAEVLSNKFKADGNLSGYTELESLLKNLDETSLPDHIDDPAIRKLFAAYRRELAKVDASYSEAYTAEARRQFGRLEELKKSLMIADEIDEARRVEEEIGQIKISGGATPTPRPLTIQPKPGTLPLVLQRDLVAYYPLDGDGKDLGADTRHAKVAGAAPTHNRLGHAHSAMKFDGENDQIILNSSLAPKQLTLSMWLRLEDPNHDGQPIRRAHWGFGIIHRDQRTRIVLYDARPNPPRFVHDTTALNDRMWHHVTITYGDLGFLVFIDGLQCHHQPTRGRDIYYSKTPERQFRIGAIQAGKLQLFHRGDVDNVGIWSRQLSPAEIIQVRDMR